VTFVPFADSNINLCTDRVPRSDGERQTRSAFDILTRLRRQPGVVLADEVGMGKTFVAMAVAASTILARRDYGPVLVMVPSSLKEKWPKDWSIFCEKCLSAKAHQCMRHGEADSGLSLLKLLDDPPERRVNIIFLTHGALHRALDDGFAKLAVIKRAFKWRSSLSEQRANFPRFAGRLLRMGDIERKAPGLLGVLLERPVESWLRVIHRAHEEFRTRIVDDPVPAHFAEALDNLPNHHVDALAQALSALPLRESAHIDERLKAVRRELAAVMAEVWKDVLRMANFRSPLLILDEAHHVKNPATRLASLFVDEEAAAESELFDSGGALGGKFDRMLFLTATPFQLGHQELIRILERFEGINWASEWKPALDRQGFKQELAQLGEALDEGQASALRLDRAWGRLKSEHLLDESGEILELDTWWDWARRRSDDDLIAQVVTQVEATRTAMKRAEALLRPWVTRCVKEKTLPAAPGVARRQMLPGAGVLDEAVTDKGLEIADQTLLPFLLAGRAQMILAASNRGRALFAEGLSSSFEAYFETRRRQEEAVDEESLESVLSEPSEEVDWYLEHLDGSLRAQGRGLTDEHPKVRATADKVLKLWRAGEKVLVFCHYRATGRALRQHISSLINREVRCRGKEILPHLSEAQIGTELERIGTQFEREGRRRAHLEAALGRIVDRYQGSLAPEQRGQIVEVMRRFIRTPSFLIRYIDISRKDIMAALDEALGRDDVGGLSLRKRLDDFCRFLATRCIPSERVNYLEALGSIQTGSYYGAEVAKAFDPAEQGANHVQERTILLPNVRLVNGEVRHDTRRKLLLAFNTPLFPEVLIASSVLAEGVDLHLNCRYVIHHDLSWNPSTLEQRTGRVDRLGSKAEQVLAPIHVYLPYIAATQDEKMYKVVRDRERWFHIVMGERFEVDEGSTERLAERVPLPGKLQAELTWNLEPVEVRPSQDEVSGLQQSTARRS
jgi:hypothetical protein